MKLGEIRPPQGRIVIVDTWAGTGAIDVEALRVAGVDGIIVKATDGLHLENPAHAVDGQWAATARACDLAGLPFGAYGVLEPHTDPVGQAHRFLDAVHAYYVLAGMLPPACDFELAANETGAEALHAARIWCDTVAEGLGRAPMLYTMPAFWDYLVRIGGQAAKDDVEALAKLPLWIAHYTGSYDRPPDVPVQWPRAAMWQASGGRKMSRNAAQLPWADIDIDVSLFAGTIDELQALGCSVVL